MKSLLLIVFCVFHPFHAISSEDTSGTHLPPAGELQNILDIGLLATGGTGVSAAIRVKENEQWIGASGMSDETAGEEIRPAMLFDIASAGKTFTAAVVLQLADEGKLSLDDPLHRWLPEYKHIDNTATIRQLLNHTSGISHFTEHDQYWVAVFGNLDSLWSPEDILAYTPEAHTPPGTTFHYSSTNYVLLGLIIEKATESSLSAELRDRLFIPFELRNTYTPLESKVSAPGVMAHGHYDIDRDGELDDVGLLSRRSIFSSVWASGPVVSSAEDLALWAESLFNGDVLAQESLDQMLDFHRPTPGEPFLSGYGLGACELRSEFFGGTRVWGHLGLQPGFMTAMLYFPDYSASMAVLINDNNESTITRIAVGLWDAVKAHLEETVYNG